MSSETDATSVASYAWREMQADDLAAVSRIAALVHPDYPERDEVFAERRRLHPAGNLVLFNPTEAIVGYVVSHPWPYGQVPALDSLLGDLPQQQDNYYVHDIALLPEARGRDAAQAAVARLADHAIAEGFSRLSLVAITGTQAFWERQGFSLLETPELEAKLASYDASARYMSRALR